MTHRYIGTKQVTAWPQERDGRPGYAVQYPDGYTSWSPADVFEAAYRVTEGDHQALTFGDALHFLKAGRKVARAGWNGKRMWIAMSPGSVFPAEHAKDGHAAKHRADELIGQLPHDSTETVIELLPHLDMRTADGTLCVGWLASQTDMLADDWMVLP